MLEQRTLDALARQLSSGSSRRAALGIAAALGLGGAALLADEAGAKKKKKKKIFCLNGNTVKAKNKKKKRRLRNQGATKGKCPDTCTPVCPSGGACGGNDGCGGICGCAGNTICVDTVCQPCTVTCTGDAATCGADLQTALSAGGDVYICPGQYGTTSGFTAVTATKIYGAGSGSNQASNTILDGQNASTGPVLTVNPSSPLRIFGIRITGGNGTNIGGLAANAPVGSCTVDSCAIVGNTGATIGGISMVGNGALVNSTVSGNTGTANVGGCSYFALIVGNTGTITNSIIENNTGGQFGGVGASGPIALTSLTVDSATQIKNNTFTAGSGERAGGIGTFAASLVTVTVNGTTISGNTTPQCLNVTGCSI